jgi:iron-sulfur cluster repair protein YtfE (RIC family)
MKATKLLQKHHKKAIAALKKLTRRYDADVLDEVATELAAHMVCEETIFYPAIQEAKPDLVWESYEEHAVAQLELKRLLLTDGDDPRFKARAVALSELIRHHVEEEEETLFPLVEKHFEASMLDDLGEQIEERFEGLCERGHAAILPMGARTTSDKESSRLSP